MSELKTNKISPATGTEVILGDDGDTFTIPTGVTATGFSDPARNFIIDGDFTQWPEGATFTSAVSSAYTSALWEYIAVGVLGACTVNRSTDVPTATQSNHQSSYSLQVDVTTADTSPASSSFYALRHIITGSDYALLHSQVVTLQFWVKSTKTGVFTVVFGNGAQNRSLPYEYTVNTTNTWEKKEITVTLDDAGTWLFTEADKGLSLEFVIATGSDLEDGTHNTWGGSHEYGAGNNVNGMDSTSNNFFLSQVGLYKGSTAPSSFVGESIATVEDQVAYYVRKIGGDRNTQYSYPSAVLTTSVGAGFALFDPPMRAAPTCAFAGTNTNFKMYLNAASTASTGNPTFDGISKAGVRVMLATAATMTTGQAGAIVHQTTSEYFIFDARH